MNKYDDIINLARPQSYMHSPMSMSERAAQFSAFAALHGHEEALAETARLTSERYVLSEDEAKILSEKLERLLSLSPEHPDVTFLCFRDDGSKPGGDYIFISGKIRRYEECSRTIIMADGIRLSIDDIVDVIMR